jgi:hypothetical protein
MPPKVLAFWIPAFAGMTNLDVFRTFQQPDKARTGNR